MRVVVVTVRYLESTHWLTNLTVTGSGEVTEIEIAAYQSRYGIHLKASDGKAWDGGISE